MRFWLAISLVDVLRRFRVLLAFKVAVSRLSWKWRGRSLVKITERTREKQRKHYTAEEKVAMDRTLLHRDHEIQDVAARPQECP